MKRMLQYRILLILLITSVASVAALSAGPYDGLWSATSPAKGDCGPASVEIIVLDSAIQGSVTTTFKGGVMGGHILEGTVQPDGTAKFVVGRLNEIQGTIRFGTDKFDLDIQGFCGTRSLTGSRH